MNVNTMTADTHRFLQWSGRSAPTAMNAAIISPRTPMTAFPKRNSWRYLFIVP